MVSSGHHLISMWKTTWLPYGCHIVSTLTPLGFQVDMWFPCGHIMVIWTLCGFQVDTTWFPCEHYMISIGTPCGFKVDTTCRSMFPWFHMDMTWFPCGHHLGFQVDTTWFPGGNYLVSLWMAHSFHIDTTLTTYGFHMNTMWCPGNPMETSTKKQLCMKPTGFLVNY